MSAAAEGPGSSPRMRGTPPSPARARRPRRFIPAHAGNTDTARRSRRCRPVHPRACGEHGISRARCRCRTGSSPRMRGTPRNTGPTCWDGRFIPAHAGNTRFRRAASRPLAVHPRACGEHLIPAAIRFLSIGSSPRMRGTPSARRWPGRRSGFIPAHAGNTASQDAPYSPSSGSSPRMRGTQPERRPHPAPPRFIPAHAGNTGSRLHRSGAGAVHPRACGEHITSHADVPCVGGSSPRMRGTQRDPRPAPVACRFIPAHAGNTVSRRRRTSLAPVHPRACGEHGSTPYSSSP